MSKQTKKKISSSNENADFKKSLINMSLNSIIFILAAFIIFLIYSLVIKFSGNFEKEVIINNTQVPSEIIQVEVLNGCGVSGVADRFKDYLRKNGFDVVNVDNYIQFDIEETMVIDRIGNLANAKEVANSLGVKPEGVFPQLNNDYFVDVSVVIGRDYYKLKPLR